jgi:DNA-binding CsgD family transcriptional regulator
VAGKIKLKLTQAKQNLISEPSLTSRKYQVYLLILEGNTNGVIAKKLGISPNTVKDYVKSICIEFNVNKKRELRQISKFYELRGEYESQN